MENSSFHTSNDIRLCDSEISIKAAFHRKSLILKASILLRLSSFSESSFHSKAKDKGRLIHGLSLWVSYL